MGKRCNRKGSDVIRAAVALSGMQQLMYASILLVLTVTQSTEAQIPHQAFSMMEELPPGYVVGDVIKSANLRQRYGSDEIVEFALQSPGTGSSLPGANYADYFSLEASTGLLKVARQLDRDRLAPNAETFVVTLLATLRQPEFLPFRIVVTVLDVNDNTPIFPHSLWTLHVSELAVTGVSFLLPAASDNDSPQYSVQEYRLQANATDPFELRASRMGKTMENARIVLKQALDREKRATYSMTVLAYDGGQPSRSGMLTVTVVVTDANDNTPVFEQETYEVFVPEDLPLRASFLRVRASDQDDELNGKITYAFASQTAGDMFIIDAETGDLSLATRPSYTEQPVYNLLVQARDSGPDPFSANAWVTVNIVDVNDHAPIILVTSRLPSNRLELSEDDQVGTTIAYVSVQDADSGAAGRVTCFLNDTSFTLQQVEVGEYRLLNRLTFDREVIPQVTLNITCADAGRPVSQVSSHLVTIEIGDVNDNVPHFSQSEAYTAQVEEGRITRHLLVVNATDADVGVNGLIRYSIFGEWDKFFTIDERSGVIGLKVPLDYEQTKSVEFAVTARDSGISVQHSAVIAVTVDIVDTNDEPPRFEMSAYHFVTFEEQPYGTEVGSVVAIDNDAAPFNALQYTLHSTDSDVISSFEIRQPERGKITVRRQLDRERRASYQLVVTVTERVEPRRSASVNVTVSVADVNDNSPRFLIPSTNDEVVYLSTLTPVGRSLKTVLATDADAMQNGEVRYSLLDGDSEGYFAINDVTGVVTLRRSLSGVGVRSWRLGVLARDGGKGEKANSIVCMLHVAVNETAVALASPGDRPEHLLRDGSDSGDASGASGTLLAGLKMQKHEFIMALLGAATLVLVVILVAAILCLKTRQRRRQQRAAELDKMTNTKKDACGQAYVIVEKGSEKLSSGKSKDCTSNDGDSSFGGDRGDVDICMISGGEIGSYTSDMRSNSISGSSNSSIKRSKGQDQPLRHALVAAAVKKSTHKFQSLHPSERQPLTAVAGGDVVTPQPITLLHRRRDIRGAQLPEIEPLSEVQREEEEDEQDAVEDADSITLSLGASASDSGHGASDEGFCARCSHSLRHCSPQTLADTPSPTLPPPPSLLNPVIPETFTLKRGMTSSFRPGGMPPFAHRQAVAVRPPSLMTSSLAS